MKTSDWDKSVFHADMHIVNLIHSLFQKGRTWTKQDQLKCYHPFKSPRQPVLLSLHLLSNLMTRIKGLSGVGGAEGGGPAPDTSQLPFIHSEPNPD